MNRPCYHACKLYLEGLFRHEARARSQVNLGRWHNYAHCWAEFGRWWVLLRKIYEFRDLVKNGSDGIVDKPAITTKMDEITKALAKLQGSLQSLDVVHQITQDLNMNYLAWGSPVCKHSLTLGAFSMP